MKKFYFVVMLVLAMAVSSCKSCSSDEGGNESITWSVNVGASGNGKLVVAYPTGALTLNGDASVMATSANDTVSNDLLNAPNYQDVLASPENYDSEVVKFAEEVNSAIHVDTLEGNWKVDITGYAKYDRIYIVIDEHWPRESTDSVVCDKLVEEDTVTQE